MPQPPIVEIEVGSSRKKVKEANPDDPDYLAALETWTQERNNKFIRYVWTAGVYDVPPDEEKERLREFLPHDTETEIKYAWIAEQLGDEDEIADLTQAILGQNIPTASGVAEAEAAFQS